jgi:hypothetical protein
MTNSFKHHAKSHEKPPMKAVYQKKKPPMKAVYQKKTAYESG